MRTINRTNTNAITLSRNGDITMCKVEAIGSWSVTYPKREMRAKGFVGTRHLSYVERFYEARIKGRHLTAYTRHELKDAIVSLINREGISVNF